LLIVLNGCAYQELGKGQSQATLHIVNNLPHFSTSSWTYYSDVQCQGDPATLGAFSKLYDQEKRVQLRAGEMRYLRVNASTAAGPVSQQECVWAPHTICMKTNRCTVELEATPVAGKVYRAELVGDGNTCNVVVTDEQTGAPQSDIHPIVIEPSCLPRKWKARE